MAPTGRSLPVTLRACGETRGGKQGVRGCPALGAWLVGYLRSAMPAVGRSQSLKG